MTLAVILKLLHVLAAFWVTVGIIGRNVVLTKARQSTSIEAVSWMMPVVNVFEKRMVIPGSSAVFLAGLVTAWAEGWPILGFIQGGERNWVLVSLILYLTLIPLIIFIFTPKGKIFEGALQEASAQGRVTPQLKDSFNDPLVNAGHVYEIAILIVIIFLMVTKPF